jgi:hypothetical protein
LDVATGLVLENNHVEMGEARVGHVQRAPAPIPDVTKNK